MPPSSGELWEHHLMPQQILVDCLLPNGVLVPIMTARDATLESLKKELFLEAKKYPLFKQLSGPAHYIFMAITLDAIREEFYDETRRLCDLRLFQPILKLMIPKGNSAEKAQNFNIGVITGITVNEFSENNDLEVITFRREILKACKDVVDERDAGGDFSRALYIYPPDIESQEELPPHLLEKLSVYSNESALIMCVWVISSEDGNNQVKYTVKVPTNAVPSDVIAETIRRRSRIMNMSRESAEHVILEYKYTYVLKVCGCDQFLWVERPVCQYKYIRQCIAKETIPQLMLHTKESVYEWVQNIFEDTDGPFEGPILWPSIMQKGLQATQEIIEQQTLSIWDSSLINQAHPTMLRVRINCATYINIKEAGKIFVRACIYHGTEALCEAKDTNQVDSSNPRWDSWLEFALEIPDMPRSARLCLSVCSESKRRNRKVQYALAWGNLQLFDFNMRHLTGRYWLYMWSMPQGMDDLLNPIGTTGSNPLKENCPCLELEFDHFTYPLSYPLDQHFEQLAQIAAHEDKHNRMARLVTEDELCQLEDIVEKDPLSDLSEQEKVLLWTQRERCLQMAKALPKLINAVKWGDRHNVAQLYELLKRWPLIPAEIALELLDCSYTDLKVREFAVRCLDQNLMDDKLAQYLLQLVQAIKYEPYLDNPLTRFLLKRSLLSQRIGNAFFWHLKSEMHQTSIRVRFGLILEAYIRSYGALKNIKKEVQALDKLTKVTDMLKQKVSSDEHQKYLHTQLQQADFKEVLENLHSPLNPAHILGDIVLSQCKVMTSKKLPLWLVWSNPDTMAEFGDVQYRVMFKNGDDLRQDMLTLQVIRLMDAIWKDDGLDLKMIPYGCLSTGKDVGVIEVVQNAKTITAIQSKGGTLSSIQIDSSQLHKWIRDQNPDRYDHAIDLFKRSCAGYCVATFVLGIGDRHPENIMVTSEGQVFHIDFGHFLDHKKKKFGINRERVPFVLTEDFQRVIAKGANRPEKHSGFKEFQKLCLDAYLILRQHASLIITLFTMMLQCGIPELQSLDDIGYIRKTLAVERSEEKAREYFMNQFHSAYGDSWTTKVDWMFHNMRHKTKTSSSPAVKKGKLDTSK